jgi:hypothetical protein
MGEFTDKRWSNVLGTITLILMMMAGAALICFHFEEGFSSSKCLVPFSSFWLIVQYFISI